MRLKRSHRLEKFAQLYDAEILPIWSQRFGKLLLKGLVVPPKGQVLDVGCGTGYPALELLERMDPQSRIIAIDPSSPMLDVAREKAGALATKRIFFRTEWPNPRLSFTDDVYDLVISNLALMEMNDPPSGVKEFARVTKPGGRVIVTLPLSGTFSEFYDIFREVLVKRNQTDSLERLDGYLALKPTLEEVQGWFESAGLVDVTADTARFTLLFQSSREFFFAPLVEHGELVHWKEIAGQGAERQDVFWKVKESIDAYFGSSGFSLSVVAGCVRGRRPRDGEEVQVPPKPAKAPRSRAPDPTGQIELGTSEIEMVDEDNDDPAGEDLL